MSVVITVNIYVLLIMELFVIFSERPRLPPGYYKLAKDR